MKKNLAFLVGITPNLAFAAGNVALSLRKHMFAYDYDLVVYYTDLPESDMAVFRTMRNCRLVKFDFAPSFRSVLLENAPRQSRFNSSAHLMAFCHFEAFSLLDEYKHVVWLDVDTSIQAGLLEITQFFPFGITADSPWPVQNNFSEPIPKYNMLVPGVCTAVMLVKDTLPYKEMRIWCYEKAVEYARYLVNADQGIINILLQEFGILPNLMPLEKWQCISWRPAAPAANIIHFGANNKIWSDPKILARFPGWYRVHLEWLKLGGSDFDRSRIGLPGNDSPAVRGCPAPC